MVSIRSSSSSFTQQSNKEEKTYEVDSFSCSSDDENSSVASSESDFTEEVSSSQSSSPTGPLQDMSSLLQQLPKRGLSKHFEGKSQSFTSLSNVRCLEDLAKPEKPYNKKLKACKSYGGLSEINRSLNSCNNKPFSSKKLVSSSRVNSCSSLNAKRMTSTFLGNNRPPMPPHRSTSTTNQTPLFA